MPEIRTIDLAWEAVNALSEASQRALSELDLKSGKRENYLSYKPATLTARSYRAKRGLVRSRPQHAHALSKRF
jgi:hypothetical protein